jgi:hypothetical protein
MNWLSVFPRFLCPRFMPESMSSPVPGSTPAERRRWGRHEDPFGPTVRYVVRPSFQCDWALVADISAGGVGLVLGRALTPGTVVLIRLEGGRPADPVTRLARVVHAVRQEDGNWCAGCEFVTALTGRELAGLQE